MKLMRRVIISWIFLSAIGCITLCLLLSSCEDQLGTQNVISEQNAIDYTLLPIYNEADECIVYVNLDGEIQLNDNYASGQFFYQNYAIVSQKTDEDDHFGSPLFYINKSGQKMSDKKYYSASSYVNKYAIVKETWQDDYIYIDKHGEQTIPGSYALAGIVNDNLAPVSNTVYMYPYNASTGRFNNHYYYINTEGEKAFDTDAYAEAKSFYKGFAVAAIADSINDSSFERKYGLINTKGEAQVEFIYDNAQDYCTEGLFAVEKNKAWGFVNTQGKVVIDFDYEYAQIFLEGFAAVKESNTTWRFIDKNGKKSDFPYVFEDIHYGFSEGLAAVKYKGLWGYIDTSGAFIIEPQYSNRPSLFINGYALCEKGIITNKGVLLFGNASPVYEKSTTLQHTSHNTELTQVLFNATKP